MGKAILRMFKKVRVLLALGLIFPLSGLMAQSDGELLDPAGYVTKYNPSFKGIGPKVYVLPAPRTKEEVLVDSYQEKKGFYDSIARKLDYQNLIEEYKQTSNAAYLQQHFTPFPETPEQWNKLIQTLQRNNNIQLATGLTNEYAWQALKGKNISQTIGLLIGALNSIQKTEFNRDMAIIQFNLANAYLYNGNYKDADALQEQYLQKAVDSKSLTEQADALVKIALIRAYEKEYRAAESSIIRRAIPIYNKTKDYNGKIKAWIQLAKIYQIQNKHTEAQWFLIQARDLAAAKNLKLDLPEIEYMLAYSKYAQQNYKVAKREFEKAIELAGQEDNKVLQLAIYDKLGEINMIMGDYEVAEQQLSQYWQLRKELF